MARWSFMHILNKVFDSASSVFKTSISGGTVAHDAPDSENPVKMGIKALSGTPTPVASGDRSDLNGTLYGAAHVNLRDNSGNPVAGTAGATEPGAAVQIAGRASAGGALVVPTALSWDADGQTTTHAALTVRAGLYGFNSTWDRWRNNTTATLLASAARTTTASSADQTNYNGQGVIVTINVTAITDTPSVVFSIEAKDPVSGVYTSVLDSAAIVGTGTTRLRVGGAITAAANLAAADWIGRTWRVTATHADADSITYSVSGETMTA